MIVKGAIVVSYLPDNGNVNANSSYANFLNVGGNYNNSDNAGLFYANVNVNSTNSNANNGSRNSYYYAPGASCIAGKSIGPWLLPKHEMQNDISALVPLCNAGVGRRVSHTRGGMYETD